MLETTFLIGLMTKFFTTDIAGQDQSVIETGQKMPTKCMEFNGWLQWIGAGFIVATMIVILFFATAPFGVVGKFVFAACSLGIGLYSIYQFFNMLSTTFGLRGSCPQGYRAGWPLLHPQTYNRDPLTGLRQDEKM